MRERLKRAIVSRFDSALVAGAPQARYIETLGIPPDRIFCPYDVVDNALYTTQGVGLANRAAQESLPKVGSNGRRSFLASGRFIGRKNFDSLITAYARYREHVGSDNAWDLVILGDGPELGRLTDTIRRFELQPYVTLPGYVSSRDSATFYARASAFVHPATVDQWGLVVNEAMAAGLPIAVSRKAGCAEDLVHEGRNGFTFDPYDTEAIATALGRLAAPSVDLSQMATMSREIISHWTLDDFAEGLWNAVASGVRVRTEGLPWRVRFLLWGNNIAPHHLLRWHSAET